MELLRACGWQDVEAGRELSQVSFSIIFGRGDALLQHQKLLCLSCWSLETGIFAPLPAAPPSSNYRYEATSTSPALRCRTCSSVKLVTKVWANR